MCRECTKLGGMCPYHEAMASRRLGETVMQAERRLLKETSDIEDKPSGARFVEAFNKLLEENPNRAPSPAALNRALGRGHKPNLNQLNGREVKLRRKLLLRAGFVVSETGKWVRS